MKKTVSRIVEIALLTLAIAASSGYLEARTATPSAASTGGPCVVATDEAIAELFRTWNLALASLDPARVASLYWPNAVLLPTVSNVPRTDTASITDYFDHFLKKFPRGTIVKRITYHGCNVSTDSGLYDFSVIDPAGNISSVSARYTFVYTYRNGEWKIQHHHSSAMPEPVGSEPKHDQDGSSHGPAHASGAPEAADAAEKNGSRTTASSGGRLRIQLQSATRTPSSYLSVEERRKVGRETVGLKVCATSRDGNRSFEVSDAAPHAEANEAAMKWAKASTWAVTGNPSVESPACAQVVVRFVEAAG